MHLLERRELAAGNVRSGVEVIVGLVGDDRRHQPAFFQILHPAFDGASERLPTGVTELLLPIEGDGMPTVPRRGS